jgi:hypothetical protein
LILLTFIERHFRPPFSIEGWAGQGNRRGCPVGSSLDVSVDGATCGCAGHADNNTLEVVMRTLLISVALGMLSPLVYILGATPLSIPGQNPPRELIAGAVAVALYFAACHYWLLRKEPLASRAYWFVPLGMLLAVVVTAFLITLVESPRQWLFTGLPMFAGGCVGALAAILVRRARATSPPGAASV